MTDINATLGRSLLKSLISLKEQKGKIRLEDVGDMFLSMAASLNPKVSEADEFMHQEIHKLANYITEAKREIFAITTNDKSEAAIIDASQHLDEVIKATEQATNSIMDAAEIIQQTTPGVGGDKEKKIIDAANQIFEACNFQDITGQRINKVIKLLEHIEERIRKLNTLFGTETGQEAAKSNIVPLTAPSDKDLLNGPQLAGKAASQEEIDMLFASLGGKN